MEKLLEKKDEIGWLLIHITHLNISLWHYDNSSGEHKDEDLDSK